MPSTSSQGSRAGGGRRWCTRGDLLTVALAAMLCSATYCFSIWHNGRNAPEKIELGRTPVVASVEVCSDASADDAELDFEARHTAENAGLSVSEKAPTVNERRALLAAPGTPADAERRGQFTWTTTTRGVVLAAGSLAGGGKGWARVVDDDKFRLTHAGAFRR